MLKSDNREEFVDRYQIPILATLSVLPIIILLLIALNAFMLVKLRRISHGKVEQPDSRADFKASVSSLATITASEAARDQDKEGWPTKSSKSSKGEDDTHYWKPYDVVDFSPFTYPSTFHAKEKSSLEDTVSSPRCLQNSHLSSD